MSSAFQQRFIIVARGAGKSTIVDAIIKRGFRLPPGLFFVTGSRLTPLMPQK